MIIDKNDQLQKHLIFSSQIPFEENKNVTSRLLPCVRVRQKGETQPRRSLPVKDLGSNKYCWFTTELQITP